MSITAAAVAERPQVEQPQPPAERPQPPRQVLSSEDQREILKQARMAENNKGILNPDKARSALDVIVSSMRESKKSETGNNDEMKGKERGELGVKIDLEEQIEALLKDGRVENRALAFDFKTLTLKKTLIELKKYREKCKMHDATTQLLDTDKKIEETNAKIEAISKLRSDLKDENGRPLPDKTQSLVDLAKELGASEALASSDPLQALEDAYNKAASKKDPKMIKHITESMVNIAGADMSDEDKGLMAELIETDISDLNNVNKVARRKERIKFMLKLTGIPSLLTLFFAWMASKMQGGGER